MSQLEASVADPLDTARLDWLAHAEWHTPRILGGVGVRRSHYVELYRCVTWTNEAGETDGIERACWVVSTMHAEYEGATLRAAIDLALAAAGTA